MTKHKQTVDAQLSVPLAAGIFDVAVVGAGVVGCAVARCFTLEGARVVVIEKARDILDGASKGNSAIMHTGFDAPTDSLELSCIREGHREYAEIHRALGLPWEKSGACVVAWTEDECERLDDVLAQAHRNGITDARLISVEELRRREPNLGSQALAAVAVPGEGIIDPWSTPYAYLNQALQNGAQSILVCEVTGGEFDGGMWRLETTRGTVKSRHVINCCGLFGDTLDRTLLGASKFTIKPRKGQFAVFDKAASRLVNSIILPVPTLRTKGVVICPTIFGNLLVGPTAEDQDSRTDGSTDEATLRDLLAFAADRFPALGDMPVTAAYAGLRPATEYKEYRIELDPDRNWITVGGIRSTGLSSALGIARHVYKMYDDLGSKHSPIDNPIVPQTPVLAECGPRDWQLEGHGKIVCHCELVTEREIRQALSGPLAARSLPGLKRRTRATMGRCQGFYCSARLAELTEGQFDTALSVGTCHD